MNVDTAANVVKSCIASSDLIPILKNIYVGEGRLVAFNGMQGVSATISSADDIKCVVNGEAFVKIVNSIPTNKLSLSMSDKKQELIISSVRKKQKGQAKPKTKVSLVSTAVKLYTPYLFDDTEKNVLFTFKLTDDVIEGLSSTAASLNESANNIALSGVMLDIDNGKLKLYATDSVRMSRYTCNDAKLKKIGTASSVRVLLPKQFCSLVIALSAHLVDKTVSICENSLYVKTAEILVYTKTPQSVEFPDYESVIARFEPSDSYCPTSPRLVDAVNRCLVILSSNTDGLVELSFKGNKIKVEASSAIGEVEESIGLSNEISMNSVLQFKADLLKQAVSTTEEIAFVHDTENNTRAFVGRKDRLLRILASTMKESTATEQEEDGESNDEE